jgi:integrase
MEGIMAKHKLSDKAVKNAKGKKYFADGGGLYLKLTTTGSKSWCFRWWDKSEAEPGERGKLREMGLGAYPTTTLAQARDKAEAALKIADAGGDPIKARAAVEAQTQAEVLQDVGQAAPGVMTLDKAAERFISEKLEPESKPESKTVPQWRSSLKEYASPFIGNKDVDQINTEDVLAVLQPIWHTVPETASRVRMRLENILAWAAAMGYRDRDKINPAMWRGHLITLLPAKSKIAPVQHFAALDYKDMPALYAELCAKESLTARALRFTMLTAARTGETIRAEWAEIDDGVWTVAADKMKAGKEHTVPLSSEAANVLNLLDDSGRYVFPAGNKGKRSHGHMSNIAQLKLLKEMRPGMTVHGFRSAFRDWTAEETDYPNHVAEMALAHIVRGVEGAYRRGSLLEKRAQMMQDWAQYLTTH